MKYKMYMYKRDHKELIAQFEYALDANRVMELYKELYKTNDKTRLQFKLEYEDA